MQIEDPRSLEFLPDVTRRSSRLFHNGKTAMQSIYTHEARLVYSGSSACFSIIIPTVWLQNLSLLSVISVGGVVTAGVVSLCLLWVGVVDHVGFHPNGPAFNLAKLPVTLGLFSFCYGSHSVFPNIYSSMKEPSEFPSVLIISFGTSCSLYAAVGICGFLMFGDSTNRSLP